MKIRGVSTYLFGYLLSLAILSMFSVFLSLYRIALTGSDRYWFLIWNLFLAWLPIGFAWMLAKRCPKGIYWSWVNLIWFILWLLFLPNTFYLVTDLIHLANTTEIDIIYDVVLMASYSLCGFVLGYTSLLMVHVKVWQRFKNRAYFFAYGTLMLCGFAIYLGRFLRWNSWDIITNPLGLIFDIGTRFANPTGHIFTFSTTLLFFVFLSVVYFVVWKAVFLAKQSNLLKMLK